MKPELLESVRRQREQAKKLRESARAKRAAASAVIARARRVRARYDRLDRTAPVRIKRQLTLRETTLRDLKQSLRDLESLRLASPNDTSVAELKADIRQTIERSESRKR